MKLITTLLISVLVLSGGAKAGVDVGKGTDIIPPDSKEALNLHKSDNARKTSPKDNNIERVTSDKLAKADLKVSPQKGETVPKDDIEETSDDISVPGADTHPVVLNDYDPNNLGNSKDRADDKKEKERKKDDKDNEKESSASSSSSSSSSSASSSSSSSSTTSSAEKDHKAASSTNDQEKETSDSQAHENHFGANDSISEKRSSFHSFYIAASMILFSEVGDKTFLIAALMAMKHPRILVFTASFSSLVFMTILSALLGHALPTLLPRKVTAFMAGILFIVFGIRLLREGLNMTPSTGVEGELEEVESEINSKEYGSKLDQAEKGELKRSTSKPNVGEDGLDTGSSDDFYKFRPKSSSTRNQVLEGISNLATLVLSPTWVSIFVMTFLGEWGDRSQVATIAMAAGSDYYLVILGAVLGHAICTAVAVVGGRLLAERISMRTVTIAGAVAFLVFAVIYLVEGYNTAW